MPSKSMVELIREGRNALDLHVDGRLAEFLGVSRRTVQRHVSTGGVPSYGHAPFVRALFPVDRDRSRALATALHVDISDLEASAKAPTFSQSLDGLLLVAADAMNMAPRDARPALATIVRSLAAFGFDLNALAEALAPLPKSRRGSGKKQRTSA